MEGMMKKFSTVDMQPVKDEEAKSGRQLSRRSFIAACLSLIIGLAASVNLPARAGRAQVAAAQAPSVALPLPEGVAPEDIFRFVVIGDPGSGAKVQFDIARQLAVFLEERPYDTIITTGDNIYPSGEPKHFAEKFEQPYAELLKRGVKFYAALGNHDVARNRTAQPNYTHFNMGGRAYYSFTKGDDLIEFFALDSTLLDDKQLKWLNNALAASKAQWKIAYFHHPLYSSGKRHGSSKKLRAILEPLFVKHRVNLVFNGHDHFYERTKIQKGIHYFVVGASGKLRRGDINRASPFFADGNDRVHSFMFLEVTPERFFFWAADADGNILDSGTATNLREADDESM